MAFRLQTIALRAEISFVAVCILFCTLIVHKTDAAVIIQRPLYVGLTNGLVGYWSFDGKSVSGTRAYDQSGQGNDGTLTSGPVRAIGKIGQGLSFDGIDDYVDLGNPSVLNFSAGGFTISAWFKFVVKSGAQSIIRKQPESGASGDIYLLVTNAGNLEMSLDDGAFQFVSSSGRDYRDNAWHHLTMVVTGSELIGYIDGSAFGRDTHDNSLTTNSAVWKIAAHNGAFAQGSVDDVRIYNRALSASEVKRLYKIGGTMKINNPISTGSLSNGLVGYWPFDGQDVMHVTSSGSASTDAQTPGSNAAVAGRGDGDGFQTTTGTGSLTTVDGNGLTDTNTGNGTATDGCSTFPQNEDDYHYFTDFNLSVPAGVTISGITVTVAASVDNAAATDLICAGLSWNGGTSTTSAKSSADLGTPVSTETFGSASDTWGRTWDASEFSNANFRVYLMPDPSASNNRDFFIDQVTVNVTYSTGTKVSPTVALDRSGQGNNGTITNGAFPSVGRIGQALSFDGTDDYMNTGYTPTYTASDSLTLSAWIKPTRNAGGLDNIIGAAQNTNQAIYFRLASASNVLSFLINDDDGAGCITFSGTHNVIDGNWHHAIAVIDRGTAEVRIYVDGVLDASQSLNASTCTTVTLSAQPFAVGARNANGTIQRFFTGSIDDVRIYNRALTADEMKRLYNMGHTN